jgi:hypothetical protein
MSFSVESPYLYVEFVGSDFIPKGTISKALRIVCTNEKMFPEP